MNIEIELEESMMDLLLQEAAKREVSAEEVIVQAIQNFMKRSDINE